MSIEAISLVLNHSKAQGRAKLVLIGIANHLGDHGAWPSIATLARYANASERSVKRDIEELIELGELVREKQAAPTSTQYKTNLYWITIESGVTNQAGVTDWVSRGDRLGKSGVTASGTLTLIRNLKEPISKPTKISDSFSADELMQEWFKSKGYSFDIDEQTELFIGHYQASGKTMKDWGAAWRNWMIRAAKWTKPVWEQAKEQDLEKSKVKRSKEIDQTKAILEEQKQHDAKATPPPKCEHGNSLVSCKPCLKALN